jgi:acyl-CoA synthetase (AMP-forming)/AMP-acid ligase II
VNVASFIREQAELNPAKISIIAPKKSIFRFLLTGNAKYERITFEELEKRSNAYANTFLMQGIKPGERILVFIKPGIEFCCIIFALFKAGLIPVFIDPGMGVEALLQCIVDVKAKALVGIPKIHHLKLLRPKAFVGVDYFFSVDGLTLGGQSFEKLSKGVSTEIPMAIMGPKDLCAILFTSGGTGAPKGVMYSHEMFCHQVRSLKELFRLTPSDKDYPCFPLFGLFSLAMGMTIQIPNVDLMKPASINDKVVVKDLLQHGITFTSGSPALWIKVATHAQRKKISFPLLRSVVTFGAPVSVFLHEKFLSCLPGGDVYTPYGSTECLPVACQSGREVLGETKLRTWSGEGTCVGYLVKGALVKILPIEDAAEPSDVGEIAVCSPSQTMGYFENEMSSKASRHVEEDSGLVFHRMGDMGRLDAWGRLWFLGRKAHAFKVGSEWIFSEEIEPLSNRHPEVKRSALIQEVVMGESKAVLVLERWDGSVDMEKRKKELFFHQIREFLAKSKKAHLISRLDFYHSFPVDTRHNIKIDRHLLAKQIRGQGLLSL